MVFASDVRRSIEFYQQLGFELKKMVEDKDKGIVTWAWLQNGRASLMLARSARAMNPDAQDFMFYMYAPDVAAYRAELEAKGLKVGPMQFPFYSPRGEFRIEDPDGFTLFVSHAD
jgi:uncharacterized glyoxalase superfamily protein PhnB